MASFSEQLRNFTAKLVTTNRNVFLGTVTEAQRSIVEGSELTGALGQQVDTGTLKNSWQSWFENETTAVIATNIVYAPQEEDGVTWRGTPITQHSAVGGPHSVRLTRAGFRNIVEAVTAREVNGGTTTLSPITAETGYDGEDGG